MSKNKGKGGKGKRKGKKQTEDRSRELEFKDESQEYAQVTKMLGNSRLEANCMDGTVRVCHIRGKFRKRVWINQGDIILLGLRDFQDEKADVILKYSPEEAKLLKAYGELPESIIIGGGRGESEADGGEGGGIAFGDGSDTEGEGEGEGEGEDDNGSVKKESDDENKETVDWNKELENL